MSGGDLKHVMSARIDPKQHERIKRESKIRGISINERFGEILEFVPALDEQDMEALRIAIRTSIPHIERAATKQNSIHPEDVTETRELLGRLESLMNRLE